ncbi:MAG: hypothetical protein Q8922_08670 [Bacteroidota bacterium]|nr:hypothetical protein [Bacteroidota bacterium]MDP4234378.1 hypothetical protein [Bacteroidota bacterium]MDP4243311.1 hypothetical protein [Bacteroidota bacterium]MDP4287996.1 hypothetical protein [Bacteroidota bacterium]
MKKPLFVHSVTVLLLLVPFSLRAQTPLLDGFADQPFGEASVGVTPYHRPPLAHYRLLFGAGGNAGLASIAPLSTIGVASYQMGESTHGLTDLFSAAFHSNTSRGGFPRRSFDEFDVLYGYAVDEEVARYESEPRFFHASLSAGIGLNTYTTRWRRFRRGFVDTTQVQQPNTFDYAIGFPVQLAATYEPFRFVGIGALLFINVNRISPNYGGAVVLEARY